MMTLGGFSGSDPILTPSQLASLIKCGTVRFFLLKRRIRAKSLLSYDLF
jgi:hypothetical protein